MMALVCHTLTAQSVTHSLTAQSVTHTNTIGLSHTLTALVYWSVTITL